MKKPKEMETINSPLTGTAEETSFAFKMFNLIKFPVNFMTRGGKK